jgi:acyl carrier protein
VDSEFSEIRHAIEYALGRSSSKLEDPDFPLVESGFVSSLDLITISVALEKQFEIDIPDSAIAPEQFRSLRTLSQLVATRRGGDSAFLANLSNDSASWFGANLTAAFRRPFWLVAGFIAAVLILDFSIESLGKSELVERLVPEYVDGNKRLYPAGLGHMHEDFDYNVSQHRVAIAKQHDGLKIGIFGDSGTIGSYTYADTSMPGYLESLLQERFPNVRTYNLAFWQQSLIKDVMILQSVREQNGGKAPFDVVLLTLGDAYFDKAHMRRILGNVPYFGMNVDLFGRYIEGLNSTEPGRYGQIVDTLQDNRRKFFAFQEINLKRHSGLYHYAPIANYIWEKYVTTPFRKTQPQLIWSHTVGGAPMYSAVPADPDSKLNFDAGLSESTYDETLQSLLVETIVSLQADGVAVILYLKPVMPNEWRGRYTKRGQIFAIDIAQDIAQQFDVDVVDTRWVLSGTQFSDTLAHYTVPGNRIIAEHVASTVERRLK